MRRERDNEVGEIGFRGIGGDSRVAGHAGTGKTTLAKQALPLLAGRSGRDFFFLDKDTAYGAFSSHIMGLLTGDPADRDSPTYL